LSFLSRIFTVAFPMRPGLLIVCLLSPLLARAQEPAQEAPPSCIEGEAWDEAMGMCMPVEPKTNPPSPSGFPAPTARLRIENPHGGAMHHHMHDMSNAGMYDMMISPDLCGAGEYYVFGMSMCQPLPQSRGLFSGMVMGNVALTDTGVSGVRSRHSIAAPNWLMIDGGVDVFSWNRLELDAMLTAELWTFPNRGYALPLQIGEENAQGKPYIDSQHPHSSPLMGLTLTDVISLSTSKVRVLRLWFAPRGESTDGPIAFMHRPTGTVNPDAPLGHHIGQDVGHVTSTVIGASFSYSTRLGMGAVEASTFVGREPSPTEIDLPVSSPDSFGFRVWQQFHRHLLIAASIAYVHDPEGDGTPYTLRLSASAYTQHNLHHGWRSHAAFIWGGVSNYDHTSFLTSLTFESVFSDESNTPFARLEVLQRTPAELAVSSTAPDEPHFVGSLTLGYVRRIVSLWGFDFSVGASGSIDFLPSEFQTAYGGPVIVTGKIFLDARFIKAWSVGGR
jgi:hypothetical protein